jgi:hypothetical protein
MSLCLLSAMHACDRNFLAAFQLHLTHAPPAAEVRVWLGAVFCVRARARAWVCVYLSVRVCAFVCACMVREHAPAAF